MAGSVCKRKAEKVAKVSGGKGKLRVSPCIFLAIGGHKEGTGLARSSRSPAVL